MSNKDNKKLIIAVIGGVAVLATSAYIYYAYKNKSEVEVDDPTNKEDRECLNIIKALGEPQFSKDGKLTFDYMIKFCEKSQVVCDKNKSFSFSNIINILFEM